MGQMSGEKSKFAKHKYMKSKQDNFVIKAIEMFIL